jgi:hypothetical protein
MAASNTDEIARALPDGDTSDAGSAPADRRDTG